MISSTNRRSCKEQWKSAVTGSLDLHQKQTELPRLRSGSIKVEKEMTIIMTRNAMRMTINMMIRSRRLIPG